MLYSIFIFDDEETCHAMKNEDMDARLDKHRQLQDALRTSGKLRPVAKLMPTTTAMTLKQGKNGKPIILDGPFAETKEQLLGFYLLEAESLEEAIEAAQILPLEGAIRLEVRPVEWYDPGL